MKTLSLVQDAILEALYMSQDIPTFCESSHASKLIIRNWAMVSVARVLHIRVFTARRWQKGTKLCTGFVFSSFNKEDRRSGCSPEFVVDDARTVKSQRRFEGVRMLVWQPSMLRQLLQHYETSVPFAEIEWTYFAPVKLPAGLRTIPPNMARWSHGQRLLKR